MLSNRLQTFFAAAVVIVFAAVLVALMQLGPGFLDPDSFYHAKMAQMIMVQGLPDTFPWLQFATIRDAFVDQHVLYHYALIPFVWLWGMFTGTRIAAVVFAALMAVALWWLMARRSPSISPWLAAAFAIVPWLTEPWLFRTSLAKAGPLALLWLFLGWLAVEKKRPWWLATVAIVYVLTHGGWLMLWVVTGVVLAVAVTTEWWQSPARSLLGWVKAWWQTDVRRLWLALVGGTAVGLIIHPHFPANLGFYWQQLVQIGMVNYQEVVRVGGEWKAYTFVDLVTLTPLVSALLLVMVVVWAVNGWKSKASWASAILTVFFLLITLKSRRYVEYYVPTAVTFIASVLAPYLTVAKIKSAYQQWLKLSTLSVVGVCLLGAFWLATSAALVATGWQRNWQYSQSTEHAEAQFAGAATWLAQHGRPGDIVFQTDWDEFPQLWYHNSRQYYVAGLDPTFMYLFSPELYGWYEQITLGHVGTHLAEQIKNQFGARYVFINSQQNQDFLKFLQADPAAQLRYQDSEAMVFELGTRD